MPDFEKICNSVQELARDVGKYIRYQRNQLKSTQIETKRRSDFVTEIDKESERRLVGNLKNIFPEAGFITEENTINNETKEYNWIIDPLDGTTNFIHGLPPYSVSIALCYRNEIVIGVVYEITGDELFYAWKGSDAYMNNRIIQVTEADTIDKALITTGFPYEKSAYFKGMMDVLTYVINHSHGIRRLGSAATDLCYLAAGRMEIFYETGLEVWDVAAASLIVKQAGGTVTDFKGDSGYLYGKEMLGSNSKLHRHFLDVLNQHA